MRELLVAELPARASKTRPEQDALLHEHLKTHGFADLWAKRSAPWWELERGQARALGILKAALGAPSMLCLDEPMAEVETSERERLLGLLEILKQKVSILWVTHHQSPSQS